MANDLEERGQALENEYFHRQEKELLAKMKAKLAESSDLTIKCPRDGSTNLKEVDFEGVKIDMCDECGGVWLDGGELAQIMNKDEDKGSWLGRLFG